MISIAKKKVVISHRATNRLQDILARKKTTNPQQSWLIVYLDVITLLLAMFILMVNQPQQEYLVEEAKLLQEKLQPAQIKAPVESLTADEHDQLAENEKPTPEKQNNQADQLLEQLKTLQKDDLVVKIEPGTIKLEMPETILFETGKSDLLASANQLLEKIAPVIQHNDFPISVEGHTDNVPIASELFPSNWELSSARATVVVRKLIQMGIKRERLKAIGYADTVPIASNDVADGRQKNRRVNIIIHAGDLSSN